MIRVDAEDGCRKHPGRCQEVSGTICTPAPDGWLQGPESRGAQSIFSLAILNKHS